MKKQITVNISKAGGDKCYIEAIKNKWAIDLTIMDTSALKSIIGKFYPEVTKKSIIGRYRIIIADSFKAYPLVPIQIISGEPNKQLILFPYENAYLSLCAGGYRRVFGSDFPDETKAFIKIARIKRIKSVSF